MPEAKKDSTFSKRQVVKRAGPGPIQIPKAVSDIASDIGTGFGELKRQMGSAVSNVRRGYERIKSFVK